VALGLPEGTTEQHHAERVGAGGLVAMDGPAQPEAGKEPTVLGAAVMNAAAWVGAVRARAAVGFVQLGHGH
jgi:predicted phage tail protein